MNQLNQNYQQFQSDISSYGLNLCAVFDSQHLADTIKATLPISALNQTTSVLLIGSKGQQFWQYIQSQQQTDGHCFDRESIYIVTACFKRYFPKIKKQQLYPDEHSLIPLQQLGQSVAWGHPSVLGLDIHPAYGSWFAYRCCFLVFDALPASKRSIATDVCSSCIEKPCQTACPAKAVKKAGKLDLNACLGHRTTNNSSCAERCFARRACPIGLDFAYSEDQLTHHSLHSLASIKRYGENNST